MFAVRGQGPRATASLNGATSCWRAVGGGNSLSSHVIIMSQSGHSLARFTHKQPHMEPDRVAA